MNAQNKTAPSDEFGAAAPTSNGETMSSDPSTDPGTCQVVNTTDERPHLVRLLKSLVLAQRIAGREPPWEVFPPDLVAQLKDDPALVPAAPAAPANDVDDTPPLPRPPDAVACEAAVMGLDFSERYSIRDDANAKTASMLGRWCEALPWLSKDELCTYLRTWFEVNGATPKFVEKQVDAIWKLHAKDREPADLEGLLAGLPPVLPASAPPAARAVPLAWSEIAERIRNEGARIMTGFDPLDAHTKGLLSKWVVTIGGAPGTGKTTLAVKLGMNLALGGCTVRHFAIDEESESILIRMLQSKGVPQCDAERMAGNAPAMLQELQGIDYRTVEGKYLEDIDWNWTAGAQRVLVVDSLQKVRTRTGEADPRQRVNAALDALKVIASTGVLVINTSELSRAAYRAKKDEENIDLMASGKESGDIEYTSSVYLVLQSVEDEPDLVKMTVVKARRGGKRGAFYARLNRLTADFENEPVSAESQAAKIESKELETHRAIEQRIRQVVLELVARSAGISGALIEQLADYTKFKWRREAFRSVWAKLLGHGIFQQLTDKKHLSCVNAAWHQEEMSVFGACAN